MSDFVLPPPPRPSVAVIDSNRRFAVRRIFCVGRNYAAHAREMGKDPDRDPPFFFTKPADAVVDSGAAVPYPPLTSNLHHEVELVVAIGIAGTHIAPQNALGHIWGYAAGIDLTRRDLQEDAKAGGRPWDWSKGFDQSAPCGPLAPTTAIGHPSRGRIQLSVNGAIRQDADIADLIWSVPDIVATCSRSVALCPGDLIYTGTPAGVGALVAGDRVGAQIEGVGAVSISISNGEQD